MAASDFDALLDRLVRERLGDALAVDLVVVEDEARLDLQDRGREARGGGALVVIGGDDPRVVARAARVVLRRCARIPRLGDELADRAAVDGGDHGVDVGKGGDEDAHDARTEMPRAFQQPDALLAGHPLVGQQQADFICVLFEQLEAVRGVRGGEHTEFLAERAGEILQRFFLVIHIQDGEFFIVVEIFHGFSRRPVSVYGLGMPA